MDERNGVGGAFRCNHSYTPCRHTSRVQERSVGALRSGKAHQAAQRLLCGSVCPSDGRGTCFSYQYFKCGKCTQCPAGKAVLAKRKASFVGFNGQQTLMQMLDCALCVLLLPVYERFNLMWCCNDISKPINQHIHLPTNICGNPFARRSAVLLLRAFSFRLLVADIARSATFSYPSVSFAPFYIVLRIKVLTVLP